jgi:hypothetical protein
LHTLTDLRLGAGILPPLTKHVIPNLHVNSKNPADTRHYRGPSVTDAPSIPPTQ